MRFRAIFIVLFSLSILLSCNKESVNPSVKMVGHGISGFGVFNQYYPDNSKSGLQYALSFNDLDAIEVDIQLTKDSLFVCYHDKLLETKTNGIGEVFDNNLIDILNADYLSFSNEKVMSFDELLSHDLSNVEVFIDVKTYFNIDPNNREWYVELINDALLKLNCKRVGVFHENEGLLIEINGNLADRYLHVGEYEMGKILVSQFDYEGVISRNSVLTKEEWTYFKEKGLKSMIFDVRASSSFYKALEKQTDYIFIDDIAKGLEFK
jgi:glycerophosphoryl diester phosphodiesterase